MTKVLLVEDTQEYQQMVVRSLGSEFEITVASGLQSAKNAALMDRFDLLLVDVGLPDGDGYQVCEQLKQFPNVKDAPVIFMTGRNLPDDKIRGYELGADDYIEKPFDLREFKVRVLARLKKAAGRPDASQVFRRGPFEIDWNLQRAYYSQGGERQDLGLTRVELKILMYLIQHEGETLSRAQILKDVLGDQVHVLERTLDRHVCSLREKLNGGGRHINTVFKEGYRFHVSV